MGRGNLEWSGTSKEPHLAPPNYRDLDPVVDLKNKSMSEYVGSGVPLAEHPLYDVTINYTKESYRCAACGSEKVLCIYFTWYNDLVACEARVELYCMDCEGYTQQYYGS